MEKEIEFLRRNKNNVNIKEVCRYIEMNYSSMCRLLKGLPDSKGTEIKIPKRCEEPLKKWIEELIAY